MKKLILIQGPNGVGKTTLCKLLNQKLMNSALVEPDWCRMINPFYYDDEIISLTISNMTHMLRSYLQCSSVQYVIFNFGFHGPRKEIYEQVMENLKDLEYEFVPITVTCDEEENVRRMIKDYRDSERIKRALAARSIYENLSTPLIDTTRLSAEETAARVIEIIAASY